MDEDRDPTGDGGNIDVGGGVIMGQGGVGEFPFGDVAAGILDELSPFLSRTKSSLSSCL